MADNTAQNGTATIAADDVTTLNGAASSGVLVQRVKIGYGDDGSSRDISPTYPLPVTANSVAPVTIVGVQDTATTGTITGAA